MVRALAAAVVGLAAGALVYGGEDRRVSSLEIGEPGHAGHILLECRDGAPRMVLLSDDGMRCEVTVGKDVLVRMGNTGDGEGGISLRSSTGLSSIECRSGKEEPEVRLYAGAGHVAEVSVSTGEPGGPSAALGAASRGSFSTNGHRDEYPGSAQFLLWNKGGIPIAHIRCAKDGPLDWRMLKADETPFLVGTAK